MGISCHLDDFAGRNIVEYTPNSKKKAPNPQKVAYRVSGWSYEDDGTPFADIFDAFLNDPKVGLVEALVIGPWAYEKMCNALDPMGSEEVVESLVAARERLAGLKHLFLGDVIYTECEISWLQQSNVVPILDAYPTLEEFRVRGDEGLSFVGLRHGSLKSLAIESGGLPAEILAQLWDVELPNLEHLELWLGSESYGGISDVGPLAPLLSGKLFPKLKSLGLCNSSIQDAVTIAVAKAPILKRLETLNLSLGNLTDEGAAALLASPDVRKLSHLEIGYHYLSEGTIAELGRLDIDVDVDEIAEEADVYEYNGETITERYNAHSE